MRDAFTVGMLSSCMNTVAPLSVTRSAAESAKSPESKYVRFFQFLISTGHKRRYSIYPGSSIKGQLSVLVEVMFLTLRQ